MNDDLQQLTKQVAQLLLDRGCLLSTAESCTGGWVAKCCTDIAGSSAWFDCGFVTYSNQSKQHMLSVDITTLETFGAVSEQTVIEMANGAINNSCAHISVAISGIAGPDGGSKDKPVGTVCFAWSIKNNSTITEQHHLKGDRNTVRRQAVMIALQGIIKNARDSAPSMG